MGNDVINRVNALGRAEGQPMIASNFAFKWDQDGEVLNYESDVDDENNDDFDYIIPPQPEMHVVDERRDVIVNEELTE